MHNGAHGEGVMALINLCITLCSCGMAGRCRRHIHKGNSLRCTHL